MRRKSARLFFILLGLAITVPALAQEGHPLAGTWYGDWGFSASERNQVTIFMSWDGKNISGIINPGPDATPFAVATLDPTKWALHLEADRKDRSGGTTHLVIDGTLSGIGSYKRTLTGTWSEGGRKGNFKITRG